MLGHIVRLTDLTGLLNSSQGLAALRLFEGFGGRQANGWLGRLRGFRGWGLDGGCVLDAVSFFESAEFFFHFAKAAGGGV
jgi:hypothetical protein